MGVGWVDKLDAGDSTVWRRTFTSITRNGMSMNSSVLSLLHNQIIHYFKHNFQLFTCYDIAILSSRHPYVTFCTSLFGFSQATPTSNFLEDNFLFSKNFHPGLSRYKDRGRPTKAWSCHPETGGSQCRVRFPASRTKLQQHENQFCCLKNIRCMLLTNLRTGIRTVSNYIDFSRKPYKAPFIFLCLIFLIMFV